MLRRTFLKALAGATAAAAGVAKIGHKEPGSKVYFSDPKRADVEWTDADDVATIYGPGTHTCVTAGEAVCEGDIVYIGTDRALYRAENGPPDPDKFYAVALTKAGVGEQSRVLLSGFHPMAFVGQRL